MRQDPEDKPDYWSDERRERDLPLSVRRANLQRALSALEAQHPLMKDAPDEVLARHNALLRGLLRLREEEAA